MRRGPDELARAGSSRKERMSLHAYADTRAGAQMMINAVDDCPGYCPVEDAFGARGLGQPSQHCRRGPCMKNKPEAINTLCLDSLLTRKSAIQTA